MALVSFLQAFKHMLKVSTNSDIDRNFLIATVAI